MQFKGISGSRGTAVGPVYRYIQEDIVIPDYAVTPAEAPQEVAKLASAMAATLKQLDHIRQRTFESMGPEEAAIFEAHMQIAQDPSLLDGIKSLVEAGTMNVVAATQQTVDTFAQIFLTMDDPYMRERGADIKDIGDRLLRNLLNMKPRGLDHVTTPIILVAHDLAPSDTASLDRNVVKGIITAVGGPTSHAAIMARTLEIPAVMGLGDIESFHDGELVAVRGTEGIVVRDASSEEWIQCNADAKSYEQELIELRKSASLPAVTTDGHEVQLFANIGKSKDVKNALTMGATGVGLYRTEFLYMDSDTLPSEEVQYNEYKKVVTQMKGKPIIIRTMDIGGDKELKCLDLPKEMNPFLGYRAIRISLQRQDMFKVQLRALLRASAHGDVQVMFPMISSVDEVLAAKALVEECKAELRAEGIGFNENMPIGIMVEIPAAAIMASTLADYVDFFSIGTNDLCQYTLAVDRMNENIGQLYDPLHPAVLQLVNNVIQSSHHAGKITGMCGEMAGDPAATLLLLGMGLDEFSMSASSIPIIKNIIRHVSKTECEALLNEAFTLSKGSDIRQLVHEKLVAKGLQ